MSAAARPGSGEGSQPGPDGVALTQSPGFWRLMGYAAFFGVVLAFASLAFLGLVDGGTNLWFTLPKNPGWFDGSLWWVAVTAAAGVLVGVLRRLFRLPAKLPGTVEDLKDQHVEPSTVPKVVAVSLAVARRRCEPRTGGGTGADGGRAGNLGLGAEETQPRHAGDEHAHRNVRSVRRPVVGSDLGDDYGARACASERRSLLGDAGRGSARLDGRVRGVLSDRGVDVRRDLLGAVVQVRGLAAAGGRSPGPGRRGARGDHDGCDRGLHAARRSSRQSDDPSLDDRGSRVRAGRRGAAADAVHRNRSAHDRDRRRGGTRRRSVDRGRVREDPRVRGL